MSTRAELEREIETRDAFLAQLSRELERRLGAVDKCRCKGLDEIRSLSAELGLIAGVREPVARRRKHVDAGKVVAESLRRWQRRIRRRAHPLPRIELSRTGDLRGAFDADQLATIVLELVSNACKYGGGRPVEIRLEARGERVCISVSDRGPGPPPKGAGTRRFVRRGPGAALPGFGVGLWLTRRIVTAQGGTLAFFRRPGGGSVARVLLPRRAKSSG